MKIYVMAQIPCLGHSHYALADENANKVDAPEFDDPVCVSAAELEDVLGALEVAADAISAIEATMARSGPN